MRRLWDWIPAGLRHSLFSSYENRMSFQRAVIYARYSSHKQGGTSTIESQLRERPPMPGSTTSR